jgi:hypothetical protein
MDEDKCRPRMGVVVIGQSPRPSVAAEVAAVLSPGIAIELVGALDGMTRAEIDAIPPTDGSDALFTLLPDGDAVVISKLVVEERAAAKIADFAGKGVAVTMLACTGKFPALSSEAGTLSADLAPHVASTISTTPSASSWPGLSRPSTFSSALSGEGGDSIARTDRRALGKDVDGRDKPGHDGLGEDASGAPQKRFRAAEPVIVLPSKILSAVVEAVLPHGRLGVFSPLPEQTALIASKWERPGIEVVGVTLRPGSGPEAVDAAAAAMAERAPDLVVMDCMGYRGADKARVRKLVGCPVILAIAAAARVVEELIA